MDISFLQHYWWALVSLLGALLVFLLFVQGGQSMLFCTAKNESQKNLLIHLLGHKWGLTYTTLVTFGGAIFASFPLYYSTSFGGAYWLWITILLLFVIQAISYEFRDMAGNLLGKRTYEIFLFLNGLFGSIMIGVAVGTFYTGGAFTMDKMALTQIHEPIISQWANGWHGLDALTHPFNLLMGVGVYLAAATLGLLFFIKTAHDDEIRKRARKIVSMIGPLFVVGFVALLAYLFCLTGYRVDPATALITAEPYKYLHNMLQLGWPMALLATGVILVLTGLGTVLFGKGKYSFWLTAVGVVLAVFPILIVAAYNHTAYFVSTVNIQNSLTLQNSSSSPFTLQVMAYVSLLIPFVLGYIAYVWHALTHKPISVKDIEESDAY